MFHSTNNIIERLDYLEHRMLTADDLYEAKQLLKVLDDLTDEGYTHLNNVMEKDFGCLSRLRALIRGADEEPFAILHERLPASAYRGGRFYMKLSDSADVMRRSLAEIKRMTE